MTLSGAVDIERRRISGELHDRVGPNLATVAMNLHVIGERLPRTSEPELRRLLSESEVLLAQTVAEIRTLSGELRPALLEYSGLEPALADFAAQYQRRTGITVHLAIVLAPPGAMTQRLDSSMEWLLYRVIQEALANCARHASATHVRIDLRRHGALLELSISDDGKGFVPENIATSSPSPGLGLLEMRERIESVQGRFFLSSRPGRGTHIRATVPLAPETSQGTP